MQHSSLVSIQEAVTNSQQGFRQMNEGLGNLHEEILNDLRQTTAQREESPEGFSLTDRPTTSTVTSTPRGL